MLLGELVCREFQIFDQVNTSYYSRKNIQNIS